MRLLAIGLGLALTGSALAGFGAYPESGEVIDGVTEEECRAPGCVYWPPVDPAALQTLHRGQVHLLRYDPGRNLIRKASRAEAQENARNREARQDRERHLRDLAEARKLRELDRMERIAGRLERGEDVSALDRDDALAFALRWAIQRAR